MKPNKLVQLFVIATTAYSLYKIVSDFLETDTGQVVKDKAADYYDMAKASVSEYVNDKMPEVNKEV